MLFPGFSRFGGAGLTGGAQDSIPSVLPTYFDSGAVDGLSGNGNLPDIDLPTGWQPGHYHILCVAYRLGSTVTMNTAGWTLLATGVPVNTAFDDDRALDIYGRLAESGDTNVSLSQSDVTPWGAQIHGFAGVNPDDPIDDIDTATDEGTALSFPSLTTTGPNRLIVGFIGIAGCASYANSNLTSITERKDNAAAAGYGQCMFTGAKASAGATGATTATAPNTDGYGIVILALKPTGEGPSVSYASQDVSSTVGNSVIPTVALGSVNTFSLAAGSLPPGMSLNTSTGEISGTASSTGTYSGIQVRLDADGLTVTSDPFTLTAIAGADDYELRFFGSNDGAGDVLIRELTMATSHGGADITTGLTPTGTAGHYSGAEGPDKAINDSTGDWWQPRCSPAASGQVTFGLAFASEQDVKEITLDPHPSFLTRTPVSMDVYGRFNGGPWTLIQSFSGWTSWSGLRTVNW